MAKWLSGELSGEELETFKRAGDFASYAKLLEVSNDLQAPGFEVEQALDLIREQRSEKAPKVFTLRPYGTFLKLSAAIALLIVGSYLFLESQRESISTGYAERSVLSLPDASEITLNARSRLTYNEKNWDRSREVTLQGEAYFRVAKGKTFTVTTDHGSVVVLGTQFNVENRKGFFEVSCYGGSVRVTHNKRETELPAGSSFLVVDGKITDTGGSRGKRPSWLDNESSFESIPLKYVLAELERQFNIRIRTQNMDTDLLFTGSFNNTNLEMALKSISTPSKISYRIEGDNVLFYAGNTPQ